MSKKGKKPQKEIKMAKQSNWIPSRRSDILTMARTWISVFTEDTTDSTGAAVKKYVAWGIPAETFAELGTRYAAAQAALTKAQESETRTPVTTAACKTAFDELIETLRQIKKRYLHIPPLTPADLKSLGLEERDTTPTRSGVPTSQVTIETYLVGRHQLGIQIVYLTGSPDDPANKEYRVHYSVIAQGEPAPTDPKQLADSYSTKRKREARDFEFGDSGKTAWLAVQVENNFIQKYSRYTRYI
jgi:hypothetical protein